jgi:phosphodiesterase/alkaline phosphatase D-like protein
VTSNAVSEQENSDRQGTPGVLVIVGHTTNKKTTLWLGSGLGHKSACIRYAPAAKSASLTGNSGRVSYTFTEKPGQWRQHDDSDAEYKDVELKGGFVRHVICELDLSERCLEEAFSSIEVKICFNYGPVREWIRDISATSLCFLGDIGKCAASADPISETARKPSLPCRVFLAFKKGIRNLSRREIVETRIDLFPLPQDASEPGQEIRFLLGSCNLPVKSFADLGSGAASILGQMSISRIGKLKRSDRSQTWMRALWCIGRIPLTWVVKFLIGLIGWLTYFRVNKPDFLTSPMKWVYEHYQSEQQGQAAGAAPGCVWPSFMIHAGDQIYYDFPQPDKDPNVFEYRLKYLDAWARDPDYAKWLSATPNYMILDDHEIINNYPDIETSYGSRPGGREDYRSFALDAYGSFVASHQPTSANTASATNGRSKSIAKDSGAYYYSFECGPLKFFVMDTRSERKSENERERASKQKLGGEMISESQMDCFEKWLIDNENNVKLVVSSVPFVAQVKRPDYGAEPDSDQKDKWAAAGYRNQRHRIIDMLLYPDSSDGQPLDNLIFLVGDMHCSYYASMMARGGFDRRIRVHELAGGPIHQLLHGKIDNFDVYSNHAIEREDFVIHNDVSSESGNHHHEVLRYEVRMEQFQRATNGIMEITYKVEEQADGRLSRNIYWKLLRTTHGDLLTKSSSESSVKSPTIHGSINLN